MPPLRRATGRDVEALARLESEAFGDAAWSTEALEGLVDSQAHQGDACSYVWLEDYHGEVAVYAAFQRVHDEAELLRVACRPATRRRGLAFALLHRAIEALGAAGVVTCHLEVAADNDAALGLYRRLGFQPVGVRSRYYRDGADAVLLRRDLPPPAHG